MRHVVLTALVLVGATALVGCGDTTGSSKGAAMPKSVDRVNSLLRGELSAVETYRQAIDKEGSAAGELAALRAQHASAVTQLQARVTALGGKPAVESGAWGAFAAAVTGTAKVFGNDAAMKALQTGEEQGTRSYESALDDADVDATTKTLIRDTLLPRQREHAATLQRLIDAPAAPADPAPAR